MLYERMASNEKKELDGKSIRNSPNTLSKSPPLNQCAKVYNITYVQIVHQIFSYYYNLYIVIL